VSQTSVSIENGNGIAVMILVQGLATNYPEASNNRGDLGECPDEK
jgi:hypothetical protein